MHLVGLKKRPLVELVPAKRIEADGLARVMFADGKAKFVLYVDPLPLNPDFQPDERHAAFVVSLPFAAVIPAVKMTISEIARVYGTETIGGLHMLLHA